MALSLRLLPWGRLHLLPLQLRPPFFFGGPTLAAPARYGFLAEPYCRINEYIESTVRQTALPTRELASEVEQSQFHYRICE